MMDGAKAVEFLLSNRLRKNNPKFVIRSDGSGFGCVLQSCQCGCDFFPFGATSQLWFTFTIYLAGAHEDVTDILMSS